MDLQTRQQIARNHTGFISSTSIAISILLMTVLGFVSEISIATIVRCIVIVEIIAFNALAYKKLQTSSKYMHCCCSSMVVVYLLTLFTAHNFYMYVIVFPITVMVMIFADNRLAVSGWIVAITGLVIFAINIPLLIIGFFKIGKKFVIRTLYSTIIYSILIDISEKKL